MVDRKMLIPAEIAEYTVKTAIAKVSAPSKKVLASAFAAGAYIAFGTISSMGAAYNLLANSATYGLGKAVAAFVFPTGLMFILIAGGDLFTGNILITLAVLRKKVTWGQAFKNWATVWLGNLLGALVVTWLVSLTGMFNWSDGLYGGVVLKTAIGKAGVSWIPAMASGILCNWIVCAIVWMTYGAKDVTGKVLTAFFGVVLFVCSGVEHSVANMAYLFAGFFNRENLAYILAAHKTIAEASVINIPNIFLNNLIPVTIGNILGGAIFIAGLYYFIFKDNDKPSEKYNDAS